LNERLGVTVLRKVLLVSILLLSAVVYGTAAGPTALRRTLDEGQLGRANTWSATSSKGQTLMGTWTAVPDPAAASVTGTWTLVDTNGKTRARGGWSAAKSPAGWNGSWRAIVSERTGEYSGTWSTDVDLGAGARLSGLFEKAIESVVSGRWRAGGQSGAWSIRAYNSGAVSTPGK
jgi:hypothetical protein